MKEFFTYLVARHDRRTAIGRLARYAATDELWPRAASYRELLGYLVGIKRPELVPALQRAYGDFESQSK